MGGGLRSETGSLTKKKGKQNRRLASEPASPWTTGIQRRATTCCGLLSVANIHRIPRHKCILLSCIGHNY